ncbi:ABC transporter substrate-binding protein [Aliiroseovarius sp. KMU-50]|uniref:ABC transporter substrate-binding protein n=1 Tax=Aliiroseovarius salicola TaxID=3009082 RepID=A0ABT4VZV0_9RHOB|nr:ABC transporter substrate-binding protein [Aliiroseovarius sp. KMU-50]MDA5093694.1 ABC transporter substrate-binding protein [Aliiroseovarius sp. KMU-50]
MKNIVKLGLSAVWCTLIFGSPADAGPKKIYAVTWEGECEHSCKGFIETIENSGFDAEVILRLSHQDKSKFPGFIEESRQLGADLVATYGTSVTLGLLGRKSDDGNPQFINGVPGVFWYVADPFGTGIAESFDGSGRAHIAGTFNRVPEAVNIRTIRSIKPDFQHLGILYNGNERNSLIKVEEHRVLSQELGYDFTAIELDPGNAGVPDPALISTRMQELSDAGVDFIYLGSSSYLRIHAEVFTEAAVEKGLPILSPYEELVRENKALVSIAARAYDVGREAAEQTLKILRDGDTPGDLPIARITDFAYVVNMEVARKLKIFPPVEILQVAETIK